MMRDAADELLRQVTAGEISEEDFPASDASALCVCGRRRVQRTLMS
jgi:hypothetical protein